MLEQIQIITPAGIETQIDLISTNKVLSITDLIIVFKTSGLLYGGISIEKVELLLFKIVHDKILETIKVIIIETIIKNKSIKEDKKELTNLLLIP